jgi:hypothetical protein
VGYCGVFLTLGFAGDLIAAGFFAAAGFFTAGFFAGRAGSATIFPTVAGLLGCSAQASGLSLCNPTQNPVELRPQPHLGGSFAGTNGIGVVTAGSGTLYGAVTTGAVGAATGSFLPVKNSTIFLNMGVSYKIFMLAAKEQ